MTALAAIFLPTQLARGASGSLSLRNDRLNFYANIVAPQDGTLDIWDGGRNGVFAGEAVFVEARNPSGLKSLNLNNVHARQRPAVELELF
jgi:hypothetical protein